MKTQSKNQDDRLRVRGMASKFGNVDLHGDIVHKGAFSDSIAQNGGKVPLFFEHDHHFGAGMPIGHTTLLEETDEGLVFEADLIPTVKGLDVAMLLDSGSVNQASFAFDILDHDFTEEGIRNLRVLGLKEISVVVWGANPGTSSGLMKSLVIQQVEVIRPNTRVFSDALDFVMDLQALTWALQGV